MIIAFEGLMCVGKTTAIDAIRRLYPSARVTPELMPDHWIEEQPRLPAEGECERYIRNDFAKSRAIAACHAEDIVLLDRYYASTVAYKLARELARPDPARAASELDRLFGAATAPDCWVLLTEDPERSHARAARCRPHMMAGLWAAPATIRLIAEQFDVLFGIFARRGAASSCVRIVPSDEAHARLDALLDILSDVLPRRNPTDLESAR